MQYRKKPVVIEAIEWNGDNLSEVMQFCAGNATYELMHKGNSELVIATLEDGSEVEAQHVASRGDWIIKGVAGEFYPCKPDIFERTYTSAEPHSDDLAVDRFFEAMKAKLAVKREDGYSGWDDPDDCSVEHLSYLLVQHLHKGDPIDIANFAMMLHQRGSRLIVDDETAAISKLTPTTNSARPDLKCGGSE